MKIIFILLILGISTICFSYPAQIKVTVINNYSKPYLQISAPQYIGKDQSVIFNVNSGTKIPFGKSEDIIATVNPNFPDMAASGKIIINSAGSCIFNLDASPVPSENVFKNIGNPYVQSDWNWHESCLAELAKDSDNGGHFKFIIQPYEIKKDARLHL